jgi:hypothetical protein
MDDTTDTLVRPALPPPELDSAVDAAPPRTGTADALDAFVPPMLPTVTPPVPRPANVSSNVSAATNAANAMFGLMPEPTRPAPRRSGFRRAASWLVVLAMLGGVGAAGIWYGPELLERATGAEGNDGPNAPLAFPTPTTPPTVIRTATFQVSELDRFGGTQTYEITADFESGVAKVLVPRTDRPDLEILTLWDQTFIRRIDEPTWFTLPRGEFPIDFAVGRARWVRTIDEFVPPAIRPFTTIDEASESSVDSTPTRRLVVSADPARLLQVQMASFAPPADAAEAPGPPPGTAPRPPVEGVESLSMEIWVDDTGLVRKSVLPAELGGETITVTSVSPDAFEPAFPAPEDVQPLTAQVLFRLGL